MLRLPVVAVALALVGLLDYRVVELNGAGTRNMQLAAVVGTIKNEFFISSITGIFCGY